MKQSKSSQGIFDRLTDSLHTLTGFNTRNCAHPEFENIKIYVTALSQKLGSVQEVAAKINKERTEMALDFEDAQRSITHWSYQEPDLEELLKSIAEAIGTISKSQNTQLLQTYNTLIDQPLEEYCNYIDAVKEALCRRDMIQYNYESTLDDSKKKRAEKEQLENLQGSTNGFGFKLWKVTNREKIRKLQQDLPALDQLVETNHDKMEIANESIKSDLERWNCEKVAEIKSIFSKIAEQHVLYYEECAEAWEGTLKLLKGNNKQ